MRISHKKTFSIKRIPFNSLREILRNYLAINDVLLKSDSGSGSKMSMLILFLAGFAIRI